MNRLVSGGDFSPGDEAASMASIATSLLRRVREADPEGWREVDYLFRPVILGWLKQARVNENDATDIAQEVMLQVFRSLDKFQREGAGTTFRGWLWTITQNKLRDRFRRSGREAVEAEGGTDAYLRIQTVAAPGDESSFAPPADRGELQGMVQRAIEIVKRDVRPETWEAFWLATVEGLAATEIAARLNMAVGSVYTSKSRVLSRLRTILGDECERALRCL